MHVELHGVALHAGVPCSVRLSRCQGPSVLSHGGLELPLSELRVVRADRGVAVSDPTGRLHVDLLEHLMAAVGALGLERGLRVEVSGPELPLLDGGSLRFASALLELGAPPSAPSRRIIRPLRVQLGDSHYEFEPGPAPHLSVSIEYAHPLIVQKQSAWDGDPIDFVRRIASARTYGFVSEADALRATSRAKGANTRDVIVLCEDGTSLSEPAPLPDECVRHKLLDLIGDVTIAGGMAQGSIRAHRPGHAVTHEAMRLAREQGVFEPVSVS